MLRVAGDVDPSDEHLGAVARDHATTERWLRGDALRGVGQLVHHLVVQRVELVGSVDRDEGDGVADLEQEGLVAHGKEWYNENAERGRSEEHTSELQSQSNLVCRLLLEKKKKKDER